MPSPSQTARARLWRARGSRRTGLRLENWQVIFELTPGSSGGRHFGSRLVEGGTATSYAAIGDRGDRPSAQDLARENGSVDRIGRDGAIPADDPVARRPSGARPRSGLTATATRRARRRSGWRDLGGRARCQGRRRDQPPPSAAAPITAGR
ncbi:MAG: PQQ-dependent sugar dehydrogenase [Roseovarius sp.]|nr:PQQ-dependent sugar dehydrogenase [Roseovarius sp.]